MDCSTPVFSVLHHHLELAQTHVHWVSDAIQPSHPLSSPSPPAFNLSQDQGLSQWVSSSQTLTCSRLALILELSEYKFYRAQWLTKDILVYCTCNCFLKSVYKIYKIIFIIIKFSSIQFSHSVVFNSSRPGLPVHHQLLEFTQTHVHRVSDAIQPSHPLSSPSPPASNPSQHQSLLQWVSSSHEVAKVLEFQLQHQSFQWTPRTDL